MNLHQVTEEFTALCSRLCKDSHSYTAINVRRHNRAMQRLSIWAMRLSYEALAIQTEVYTHLLQNADEIVKLNAASFALKYGVCKDMAVSVLEHLQLEAMPLVAFDAEMTLKVWRGEFPGRTL